MVLIYILLRFILGQVLRFTGINSNVHEQFRALLTTLNGRSRNANYTLRLANRLFFARSIHIRRSFRTSGIRNYRAYARRLNFAADPERCRRFINSWVANKTEQKIKKLLSRSAVDRSTSLVLVNAIYFRSSWRFRFDLRRTSRRPFHVSRTEQVDTEMMDTVATMRLGRMSSLNTKMVEIPYANGEAAMYVLLPDKIDGLPLLEGGLNVSALETAIDAMRPVTNARLTLPKFKMEEQFDLRSALQDMGIGDLFTSSADLTGMSNAEGLYVSKVVHKAYIDVNEEGTEAAAATAVIVSRSSLRPLSVVADRPFLFILREQRTKSIVFIGRYVRPPTG